MKPRSAGHLHVGPAMHKLGAFAVILDGQSRVLLCHRTDRDAWNLPGGGVELLESPWEAVVREVEEEVGLKVDVQRLVGLYAVPEQEVLALTFVCTRSGGAERPSEEADQIQWFHPDRLPPNTLPRHVERVKDALANGTEVFMRVQAQPGAPADAAGPTLTL